MKKLALSFTSFLLSVFAFAQKSTDYLGSWEGVLNVGSELRLVFHISQDKKGDLKATADSPDQNSFGHPCDTVIFSAGAIRIEMKALNAFYSGRIGSDSVINGSFTQGMELPLTLKKINSVQRPRSEDPRHDRNVEIQAPGATLSGSLLHPAGLKNIPVVLIIAGSGPTDRNGNSGVVPGKNNSLQQLADSLEKAGIASLRYDKRAIGKSVVPEFKEEELTIDDFVADAKLWYDWLQNEGYKNIFIAGHSEGSMIALLMAQTTTPAGLISIAGAGRKATDIFIEQLTPQMTAADLQFFKNSADSLIAGHSVTNVPDNMQSLLRKSVQPYLRSWFIHDPKNLIAKVRCPVLILQGSEDIQVTIVDANLLKEGKTEAELAVINNMNHVLKIVDANNRTANIKAYSDPTLPLSNELVNSIVKFIKKPNKKK